MKKLFYSSLIFLFYTHHAFSACNVVSYPEIIKLNKRLDSSIIQSSDCPQAIQENFMDFVSSATGNLNAKHLSHIFKTEYQTEVTFKPHYISVKSVEDKISTLLNLGEDAIISKVTSLHNKASIQLSGSDKIKANCNNCESAGQKNIKLYVNNSPIWLSGHVFMKRTGFILNQELNPFQEKLNNQHFTKKTFFDDGKKHLFQDISQINFYKTNKRLQKGKVLKTTDLSPLTLIRPGQKIKVILKGKNISLKSSAYSRAQGKIGDFIEVYNTKTNKKVTAQVVDFNTVMVQL